MASSSPARLIDANPNIAGIKRRAPSLLPAFEPSSSPPRFKRQKSRVNLEDEAENCYPDNEGLLPSSSLGMLPSSPPPPVSRARPTLQRTESTVSERAPLAALPSITLPANGEQILLGRSTKSSHYGLSANRLISRVHVKASYKRTANTREILIECMGWNGVKVHCQGQAWDLAKGDSFRSETEHADIMLDVQDSRVVLNWPGTPSTNVNVTDQGSPIVRIRRSPSPGWENDAENLDPRHTRVPRRKLTPVSPRRRSSVAGNPAIMPSETNIQTDTLLEIYEDDPVAVYEDNPELPDMDATFRFDPRDASEEPALPVPKDSGFESDLVIPSSIVNFSASQSRAATPTPSSRPTPSSPVYRRKTVSPNKYNTLENHLTNQLAFSRVATLPLSELFANLPSALAKNLTTDMLQDVLTDIECIGEVKRYGKDAAGRPLESQFYYLADADKDEGRRMAVGGRAGVRSCRKTHKVCLYFALFSGKRRGVNGVG